MSRYAYRVSGWTVGSDRPLSFLPVSDDMTPDILVEFGEIEPARADPVWTLGPCSVFSADLVDLRLPSGLGIRISDGRTLRVDRPAACTDVEMHTVLFGAAFTILAYQRGSPTLHASAVEIDGEAVAVAGHSGAGKSTTARALMQRGYRLLTDDQLIVEAESGLAHSSYPSTKLWAETALLLGQPVDGAERIRPDVEKFHLTAPDQFVGASLPLRAIFVLAPDRDVTEPTAHLLPVPEAIATLAGVAHCPKVSAGMGVQPLIFRWAAALAGRIPVHLVRRPTGADTVDALVDLLTELSADSQRRAS